MARWPRRRYHERANHRLPPARHDPLSPVDSLFRKVPKVPGFIEACRTGPAMFRIFDGRVPGEFFVHIEPGVVEVACPCGATPKVRFNVPTPCDPRQLEPEPEREVCDRWFLYDGAEVRVARQLAYLA